LNRTPPAHDADQLLSTLIFRALERAREALLAEMARQGLLPAGGWRVKEELRHVAGGTEWVFSPIHLREPSPDLAVRVMIDAEGRLVEA
jgi:hypothetical protein